MGREMGKCFEGACWKLCAPKSPDLKWNRAAFFVGPVDANIPFFRKLHTSSYGPATWITFAPMLHSPMANGTSRNAKPCSIFFDD